MKLQEIISSCIMFVVSALVLVGFTIAWYTNNHMPAVTGIEIAAAEMGSVKVALEPGGQDISELEGNDKYAELVIPQFANVDENDVGELASGVHGQVTFYVTPITSAVRSCKIVPMVRISQDGSIWYPLVESVDGIESTESAAESSGDAETPNDTDVEAPNDSTAVEPTMEELYEILGRHFTFYADATMTQPITAESPYLLNWTTEDSQSEKTAILYWKWHYEYPFTAEEEAALSAADKRVLIRTYDEEDMILGNNISQMKFYVTFSAQ